MSAFTRQKDSNVPVVDETNKCWRDNLSDGIFLAVLMDLRDELKQLNSTFMCPNAQEIPALLREIGKNTKKPVRKRKEAK